MSIYAIANEVTANMVKNNAVCKCFLFLLADADMNKGIANIKDNADNANNIRYKMPKMYEISAGNCGETPR